MYQEAEKVVKKALAVAEAAHYDDLSEKLEACDDESLLACQSTPSQNRGYREILAIWHQR